jgi:hypothetical protein
LNSIDPRHPDHIVFTCNDVWPGHGLFIGSRPYPSEFGEGLTFSVIVLCDGGWQGKGDIYPWAKTYDCPLMDDEEGGMLRGEESRAWEAGYYVSQCLERGERVLVSCHAGHNRSGLVAGLAMVIGGVDGPDAVKMIRENRPGALYNSHFAKLLADLEGM